MSVVAYPDIDIKPKTEDEKRQDKYVEYVSSELLKVLNGGINKNNTMAAALHGVLIMKKFQTFTGDQKKKVLVLALEDIVNKTPGLTEQDKTDLDLLLECAVPDAIDGFVSFGTGIYNLASNCGCFPKAAKNPV